MYAASLSCFLFTLALLAGAPATRATALDQHARSVSCGRRRRHDACSHSHTCRAQLRDWVETLLKITDTPCLSHRLSLTVFLVPEHLPALSYHTQHEKITKNTKQNKKQKTQSTKRQKRKKKTKRTQTKQNNRSNKTGTKNDNNKKKPKTSQTYHRGQKQAN